MQRALVIGMGPLGRRVLKELERRGIAALGASRSRPADFEGAWQMLDARDNQQVRECAKEFDLVFLCAAPKLTRWSDEFVDLVAGVLEGLKGTNKILIFASNMYAYGQHAQPLTEQSIENPAGIKGKLRQQLDRMVLAAHRKQGLRTAVVRGSSFYGPQVDFSVAGTTQIRSMLNGKTIDALGSVDQPHSLTFIDDFARAMVSVALSERAWGQIWHAPVQDPVTLREFMTALGTPLGKQPKFRVASPTIVNMMALFNPEMREYKETLYSYTKPFIVDDSKYCLAFKDGPTPLRETFEKTIENARVTS